MSYLGDGTFLASQSSGITAIVNPSFTATTLVILSSATGRGYILDAHAVPVVPGGGTPSGSVTFAVNRRAFRTVPLVNGEAQWFVATANGLRKWFTASYRSDAVSYTNSGSNTVFVNRRPAKPIALARASAVAPAQAIHALQVKVRRAGAPRSPAALATQGITILPLAENLVINPFAAIRKLTNRGRGH